MAAVTQVRILVPAMSSNLFFWIRSDDGLTLETSAFRIPVRWPIYIINSVDKTKFLYVVKPAILMFSFPKSLSNVCKNLYECLINKNCFLFR